MEATMNEVLAKARAAKLEKAKDRERYLVSLEDLELQVRRLCLPAIQKYEAANKALATVVQIRREVGCRP